MKALFAVLALVFTSNAAHASAETCVSVAERAAYKSWYKPGEFVFGDIAGGTDIIWHKGDVVSYQVSIQYRKPDSNSVSYANYSVRVRLVGPNCQVLKVRKF